MNKLVNRLVKICGIKTLEGAETVVENGGDLIGFNFVKSSKNYIKPEEVKTIMKKIKGKIKTVGIFRDQSLEEVNDITTFLSLDYVQLHGDETIDYCKKMKADVIKAFALDHDFDVNDVVKEMKRYQVAHYLVDRKKQGQGEILNIEKLNQLCQQVEVFIAGGLNTENVSTIVSKVKPMGVDVSGGVKTNGKEDREKIKQFINNSKYVF